MLYFTSICSLAGEKRFLISAVNPRGNFRHQETQVFIISLVLKIDCDTGGECTTGHALMNVTDGIQEATLTEMTARAFL